MPSRRTLLGGQLPVYVLHVVWCPSGGSKSLQIARELQALGWVVFPQLAIPVEPSGIGSLRRLRGHFPTSRSSSALRRIGSPTCVLLCEHITDSWGLTRVDFDWMYRHNLYGGRYRLRYVITSTAWARPLSLNWTHPSDLRSRAVCAPNTTELGRPPGRLWAEWVRQMTRHPIGPSGNHHR